VEIAAAVPDRFVFGPAVVVVFEVGQYTGISTVLACMSLIAGHTCGNTAGHALELFTCAPRIR
jgi:hypothetical protein